MSLKAVLRLAFLAAVAAGIYWIATHTYWADQVLPRSPRGEALTDPFYAAERLTRTLGARAFYDRLWGLPPTNAVVVTAFRDWNRSSIQRAQLERWVESGGRLVTAWTFFSASPSDTFSLWSGVTRSVDNTSHARPRAPRCRDATEHGQSLWPAEATPRHYQLCGFFAASYLAGNGEPLWQVTDDFGAQALRVGIGRGSVTVMNGVPFTYTQLLDGTHAALFVAATQLHSGDDVHFLSDEDHASLLALVWRFGAPVVVLLLAALLLALWRAAPRFGPVMASPAKARRSLAEQIRGTGQFLLRVGDGQALHAATVRALLAAATRRISAFESLTATERVARLARASGFPAEALAAAISYTGPRRPNELRSAIALLEATRRVILHNKDRSPHGN